MVAAAALASEPEPGCGWQHPSGPVPEGSSGQGGGPGRGTGPRRQERRLLWTSSARATLPCPRPLRAEARPRLGHMVTRLPKATALGPLPQQDSVWRRQNITCWHCVCAAPCVRALLAPHWRRHFPDRETEPPKGETKGCPCSGVNPGRSRAPWTTQQLPSGTCMRLPWPQEIWDAGHCALFIAPGMG